MKQQIAFVVYGKIVPMARARVFMDKKTGRVRAANPANCTDWKNTIRAQALPFRPEKLFDGALSLHLIFQLPKPVSKPRREQHPRWKPDFDNLTKAVTDALEGLLYTNDSRIVQAEITKIYGSPPQVWIRLTELD